jgi:HEAT repeat protein
MLIIRANERVTLVHPVISGYLACRVLAASGGGVQLVAQPAWAGRSLALRYLTMVDIQAAWLNDMLAEETIDALLSGLLTAARWLRDLPEKHPWMPVILRRLAGCLQKESLPLAIRARALAALVFSGNSGVVMLLRQSLGSPDTRVRQLSALGTGILRDAKAISEISNLLSEPSPNVNRAAILALVAIQDKSGLELVAYALIQGDEGVRRAAAEALTNYPEEGYPTLEEGCTVEDPGVRRAVVFGLSRVKQPWAVRLLEKMRTEDNQWLVQDAATQALDALSSPHPRIPSRLPSLTQTPWLISFAGERGMGVAPGKPAYELLYLALREGNEDQKQAALYYLSQHGNESAILPIYSIYFSTTGELQEASYNTLWNLAAAGVTLPPPVQYGYK